VSAITVKYSQLAENLREALMNSPAFIKQHPVLTYYALTFAISWGAPVDLVANDSLHV